MNGRIMLHAAMALAASLTVSGRASACSPDDAVTASFERELNHAAVAEPAATGASIDQDLLYPMFRQAILRDDQVVESFARELNRRPGVARRAPALDSGDVLAHHFNAVLWTAP